MHLLQSYIKPRQIPVAQSLTCQVVCNTLNYVNNLNPNPGFCIQMTQIESSDSKYVLGNAVKQEDVWPV